MLGISYKSPITDVNKVLSMISFEFLYYSQIWIVIKLLHHTKKILLTIENGNMLNLDLNDDINRISSLLNIDKKTIIIYPDKTRQMLLDMY